MAETYEKRSGKATRQKYVKDRRDKVVQVRMNDAELSLLDEQRGTCSRSNFLRGELYASRYAPPSREVVLDVPALDRVRVELNRIGVNMNQIARRLNADNAKGVISDDLYKKLLNALIGIRNTLQDMTE